MTHLTEETSIDSDELALYHALMAYRASLGLPSIPLSQDLTTTAGRHADDTYNNIWLAGVELPEGANLHSWSDAFYYSDHRDPSVMWDAPRVQAGTQYEGAGFEISAAGFDDWEAALVGWQNSPGHNNVIINQDIWAAVEWNAIGIGVEEHHDRSVTYQGNIYHVWFGREEDSAGGPDFDGGAGNDRYIGTAGDEVLSGGDGADTLNGGAGDDFIFGGATAADLRDAIFGGDGNDTIDAGHGNDLVYGGAGNDQIAGGFGVDELIGQAGDDVITGSAFSDLIFGGTGNDFINGGFGHDRVNGGAGADQFYHLGIADHGSDWVQDYSAADGDRLFFGADATRDQFQLNLTRTEGAGDSDVNEAFVIYRPTGQIIWALVDGAAQDEITLRLGDQTFDLMA